MDGGATGSEPSGSEDLYQQGQSLALKEQVDQPLSGSGLTAAGPMQSFVRSEDINADSVTEERTAVAALMQLQTSAAISTQPSSVNARVPVGNPSVANIQKVANIGRHAGLYQSGPDSVSQHCLLHLIGSKSMVC